MGLDRCPDVHSRDVYFLGVVGMTDKEELLWGIGVLVLLTMAIGWYVKLTVEAEHMDVIGFAAVMFVLGVLVGVSV